MNTTKDLLKAEITNFHKSFQAIVGLATAVLGASALFMHILESRIAISLLCIGFFFIALKICHAIISAKRKSFEITTTFYSKNTIKTAKICKIVAFIFLLPPILFSFQIAFLQTKPCVLNRNMGLLITPFSDNPNDPFSHNLFDKVESELINVDTINVFRSPDFVRSGTPHYTDSLRLLLGNFCLNHGLLVFGERSQESNSLFCNIYINNVEALNVDRKQIIGKTIIHLRNPDLINFSIDSQSNAVAEFILGLLYYNAKDYSRTQANLIHSLEAYGNNANPKFSSYCHLYLGNAYMLENKYNDAVQAYKKGIKSDSLNGYLHYNLANALLSMSKADSALIQYKTAQRLNNKLTIPTFDSFPTSELNNQQLTRSTIKSHETPQLPPKVTAKITPRLINSSEQSAFHIIASQKGKYGLTSPKGDTLAPCEYDSFYNGEFTYREKTFFIAEKGGKFGALGVKGNIAIPFNHPSVQRVMAVIKILVDNEAIE